MLINSSKQCSRLSIPENAASILRSCIISSCVKLKKDSVIVFLCGAESKNNQITCRDILMHYAMKNLKQLRFFMAESVFEYLANMSHDLLTIENQLADIADCIIIVLESPGAIAELGAFANHPELTKITLAINDIKYKSVPSFITNGPIAKLNQLSDFKPMIYGNLIRGDILRCMSEIEQRLTETIVKKKRSSVDLSSYELLKNDAKIKMMLLHDIVSIFSPIQRRELIQILEVIYGKNNYDIQIELAILRSIKLIHDNDEYICSLGNGERFFDFSTIDIFDLRSNIINHYFKYKRERLCVLKELL
ncbi:MAG: retron St85 family effector protein [Armatimonadota bacterium]